MKSKPRSIPRRIVTRRLVLTVPRRGDGQTVNQAVRESFRELAPWMPWAKRLPSAAETEAFCREAGRAFRQRKEFPFLIRLRATGAVIGGAGLVRADWTVPKSEVGYWLQAGYTIPVLPELSVWALTGLANPNDKDLVGTGAEAPLASVTRSRNQTSSFLVRYQNKGYTAGVEYSNFRTAYTNNPNVQKAQQFMLSGMYFF